jgi:pimeloyl-ACP methyl ester carboxylesterase
MAFAHHGDVDLFHETFGDRDDPALLLVNGLGSQCINFHEEWCARFAAEGFFVVRFDNRDVGLSTKLDGASYTLSDMAADAVAVLDHLAVERAHVVGLSLGGMIVQTLAIEHADRLLSMTSVMSTTGDADVGNPSPEALALILSPPPTDRDAYIANHLRQLRTWGSPAAYDEARISANAARAYDRCFCPEGQARQLAAVLATGSRTEALRNVRVPALVIHGDADRLVDPSGGRRTAEAIPGASFVLVAGMGHDYPPEHWDRLVRLVTEHARAAAATA